MKITLSDGATLEGTVEQVTSVMSKLGYKPDPNVFYLSESKGLVHISDMATQHIKNAVLKIYRSWVEGLSDTSVSDDAGLTTFLHALEVGPSDESMMGLIKELIERKAK